MTLTKIQKNRYLESGGNNCPVCRSENIEGMSDIQFEDRYVSETVKCNDCNIKWLDIYNLDEVILM